MKKALLIAIAALLIVLFLFEIELDLQISLPREVQQPDAAREAQFDACLREQDRIVHGETFAAIDNPDVQREVLARRMEDATGVCREQFPRRTVTVRQPFQFNLVDLEFRY